VIVTLLSDFGTQDAYVGIMKGVILRIAPEVRFVDLTHDVPPQDVVTGALLLRNAVRYFPSEAIHVAVVDPGVGSARDPVAVLTESGVLVGPNNGLLHPAASAMGLRAVRRIECEEFFLQPLSRTFHGRDVFAPVAAHLALGTSPETLGPLLAGLQPLGLPEPHVGVGEVAGEVIHVDHFGNLVTSISSAALAGIGTSSVAVLVGTGREIPLLGSYSDVAPGASLAIVGSWDQLEISVRNGSAARELGVGVGATVVVRGRGKAKNSEFRIQNPGVRRLGGD
jgi:S-adenosyl-L-methionine hydrolase (adenosine-forming)